MNFQIELLSIPTKAGKQSLPISIKKLSWKLRNCPALHKNRRIFHKQGVSFHKSKNFQRTETFLGRESPTLAYVFDRIAKFWVRILPSRPWNQVIYMVSNFLWLHFIDCWGVGRVAEKFLQCWWLTLKILLVESYIIQSES